MDWYTTTLILLPLISGNPSYVASFIIPQGWSHKKGTSVYDFHFSYLFDVILFLNSYDIRYHWIA